MRIENYILIIISFKFCNIPLNYSSQLLNLLALVSVFFFYHCFLFPIQMLGSCPVCQAQGVGCTDEAVQQIVANAKKVMIEYDAIGWDYMRFFVVEKKWCIQL